MLKQNLIKNQNFNLFPTKCIAKKSLGNWFKKNQKVNVWKYGSGYRCGSVVFDEKQFQEYFKEEQHEI